MKISKKNVRYLIFEGGGGKGLIYSGAAKALGEIGVLEYFKKIINSKEVFRLDPKKIQGVAGTSVGSLAAVLIAAGYTPDEMHEILTKDFGLNILDKVEYGTVPTVSTLDEPRHLIKIKEIPEDKELFDKYWSRYVRKEKFSMRRLLKLPGKALNQVGKKFITSVLKWYILKNVNEDSEESSSSPIQDTTESAVNKILETTESLNSIKYDLGFFLSEFTHEFVDDLIEKKSGIKNCTFKQFYNEFNIDLVVTGFDINKRETLYFRNNKTWGELCVADAVRMSVSIPFIFKPVHLCYETGKILPVNDDLTNGHLIVDGGLGNNFPLHAFDKISSRTSKLNSGVLGIRFEKEISPPDKELTVGSYAGTIFSALLGQTTELQIRSQEEQEQVIDLEHEEVSTLDFIFTDTTKKYVEKAYNATMKYFE
ncbi:MAG: patatin-like phospholipase family protein [Promethearchaeota archaeon]